jgi:glycolate oxidase
LGNIDHPAKTFSIRRMTLPAAVLPPLDPSLVADLAAIAGPSGVLTQSASLTTFECDGLTLERAAPQVVVYPRSTDEAAAVLTRLARDGVPFVPRGAGTGLAGGTIALAAPVVVCTSRMTRILQVDIDNRRATVEAGVVNLHVTRAVAGEDFLYAPDPSSQQACTIGGNVGTNSGGPHTLKYGVTVDHVLGVTLVTPDGAVHRVDVGPDAGTGFDLAGLVTGHEGTFGLVTEVTVRLTRKPRAVRTLLGIFDTVADATRTVSAVIASGIVPAAVEMMDNPILAALNQAFGMDFPEDAAAVLLIEIDGLGPSIDRQAETIERLCRRHRAREVRRAKDEAERARLWAARKKAFGAIGRLAPNYMTQDGVVPRTKLPEVLESIRAIAARHDVRVVNVFHAGDGNLHPCMLYDERDPDLVQRTVAASREILDACLALGGSLSGEHGIGVEKVGMMARLFFPADLEAMHAVRAVFDPDRRSNPWKTMPERSGQCVEVTPRKQAPA